MTQETPRLAAGTTLAIGSMPHRDTARAVDLLLQACPEAPCWPQLPALGFQEDMVPQFAEGVPCLRIDRENRRLSFGAVESEPEALTRFYEDILGWESTGDLGPFAVSRAFAEGLYAYRERLDPAQQASGPPLVKGQTTGPLTFGLSILDDQGLPALFNETLSDVIVKAMRMKALWQVDCLKPLAPNGILFVDEPVLASFGSAAFINLSRRQAVSAMAEVFSAVKEAGFLVGSHCCANTDWSLMVEAGVDIINFDAYAYTESVGLYARSIGEFLKKGGYLAWGIVPSTHLDNRPDAATLHGLLEQGINSLEKAGLPPAELRRNLLLTTSCGLATLTEAEAEQALQELKELGARVRADS